jgi:hypothetical protein
LGSENFSKTIFGMSEAVTPGCWGGGVDLHELARASDIINKKSQPTVLCLIIFEPSLKVVVPIALINHFHLKIKAYAKKRIIC